MSSKVRRLDRSPLRCEELECRATPAQFGVPWTDSAHLTVSFVPDGTTIAGETSKLSSSLDAQLPRGVWQEAILKAIQTWHWARPAPPREIPVSATFESRGFR